MAQSQARQMSNHQTLMLFTNMKLQWLPVKRQAEVNFQEEILDSDFATDASTWHAVKPPYVEPEHPFEPPQKTVLVRKPVKEQHMYYKMAMESPSPEYDNCAPCFYHNRELSQDNE